VAGRIPKSIREKLEQEGVWLLFRARREQLKKNGMPAQLALDQAMGEALSGELGREGSPIAPDLPGEEPKPKKRKPRGEKPLAVAPKDLAGKAATEPEIARWVFRNVDNPSPSAKECPDPFAWTLLRMCRQSESFLLILVKDVWTKLLSAEARRAEAAGGGEAVDGKVTLELIEKIKGMSEKARNPITGALVEAE
jgi:hypothetical protein